MLTQFADRSFREQLRDLRPDEEVEDVKPVAASAAAPELYADHHLNALSMPKPTKSAYVNGRKRRAADDSDSSVDLDEDEADEEAAVEPAPAKSGQVAKKTQNRTGSASKAVARPSKGPKVATATRVSVRIPSVAKRKQKVTSADTARTRSLRSRAEE